MPKKPDEMSKPRGVSLKISEWKEIEKLADDLGWKPGAVVAYAVRYFLKELQEGNVKTDTRVTKTLPKL